MSNQENESPSTLASDDVKDTSAAIGGEAEVFGEDVFGDDVSGEDAEPAIPPTLEEQLDASRQEAQSNFERFLRAKADIENLLKRQQRELADRARYDGEDLARGVLPAVDDLERALSHSGEAGANASALTGGVELVLKGLLAALQRNGVERVEAEGKTFDPAEHEAVAVVETDELPPNTVVAVFRAGYKIRDRLLRAAMVTVSKASASQASADEE